MALHHLARQFDLMSKGYYRDGQDGRAALTLIITALIKDCIAPADAEAV